MAFILSIETASTNCSVSLSQFGKTLFVKEDNSQNYSHAESLHVFIDTVFKESQITVKELDAIAVSKGPGSYTGLRIGVSAAKGLCYALNKPLIAIPTLQALTHQVTTAQAGVIVAMLDARRMEVYSAIYHVNYHEIRETKSEILDENAFADYLNKGDVYFIGTGVEKTKALINHANAIFIEDSLPSSNTMSAIAYQKYLKKDFENLAYFEPYYLKDFLALKSQKN